MKADAKVEKSAQVTNLYYFESTSGTDVRAVIQTELGK